MRFIIVIALILAVAIPAVIYIGLSIPAVQEKASREMESRLSELLGAEVGIDRLMITPFNRASLRGVTITDNQGDTIAAAGRLGAGISLTDLAFNRRLVLNYIEVLDLDLRLSRDSANAPLNIQPVIDRLSKPGGDGGVADLNINAIVIRRSSASYNIKNQPPATPGTFDPNHISLRNVRADLRVRLDKPGRKIIIDLPRFAATESRSNLTVEELTVKTAIEKAPAPSGDIARIVLDEFSLRLPQSQIALQPTAITLKPDMEIPFRTERGTYVTLSDFSALLPEKISRFTSPMLDSRILISAGGVCVADSLHLDNLDIAVNSGAIRLSASEGLDINGFGNLPSTTYLIPELTLDISQSSASLLPFRLDPMTIPGDSISYPFLPVVLTLSAEGSVMSGNINMGFTGFGSGTASASVDYDLTTELKPSSIEGRIETVGLSPAMISMTINNILGKISTLPARLPRELTSSTSFLAHFRPGATIPDGSANIVIDDIILPKRDGSITELTDISLDLTSEGGKVGVILDSANDGMACYADISADIYSHSAAFDLTIDDLDLSLKGGEHLSLTALGNLTLQDKDSPLPVVGTMVINDIVLAAPGSTGLNLSSVAIESHLNEPSETAPTVTLSSDILSATLHGEIDPSAISYDVKALLASLFPEIMPEARLDERTSRNNFTLEARILSSKPLENIMKLPVIIRYPVDLSASLSSSRRRASLRIEAPFLWQGNKEINGTALHFIAASDTASFAVKTRMPTKNGMMDFSVTSSLPPRLDPDSLRTVRTNVNWHVDALRNFSGDINFNITPAPDSLDRGKAMATIDFLPGHMIFNDTVWTMEPSVITARRSGIDVDGFRVGRQGQHIEIDGRASASISDSITVSLANVDLDYVFETLNIPNAMFGGIATGEIYAAGILGKNLSAYTPDLFVRNLKYNFSLMGDTHIRASFDPDIPAVNLDARVDQPNGRNSFITGYIKPTTEGYIDLDFTADKIEVGFMKPFMSAFASNVGGFASGTARLFGTFHDVNMSGDIFAEDLALTLDFTGTTYWATDSVRLTPGYIDLDNITLRDRDGHTARLDGFLRHTNFHEPRFQFRISNADDLLVYDLPESPDRRWYGTIYGDGSASVDGIPGKIDIKVDMTTADHSSFTFILSDAEEAYDYQFITFRDRNNPDGAADVSTDADGIPGEVIEMRRALEKKITEESSGIYDMAITVRVNPLAQLIVVMDPVGGDAIRARGNGDMTLTYNSASEDLGLRGDYTLDNGTYNFTFQDIIRKDFRINSGSKIRFNGDPYAAQLDIEAAYRLTANLSDLDESFLDDPELNRTTVPVDATINVTGDMRAPEITYDLNFPTLKDDVKRKVNSIVSTEDMRARQMLYLLALNRFYTPEYMTATKGNELFSVASSTISSQLSNLLGSLAENWTIAPNIRSDRGDFSDVEFDLALSSSLLNNRLIFNGNFGYRDKSLNNNSFIGDFDLEYLLNRSGSLRLKAYNRYNDQNYYVKNALTTQGVGIVFRRDFDSLGSWLRAIFRRRTEIKDSTDNQ